MIVKTFQKVTIEMLLDQQYFLLFISNNIKKSTGYNKGYVTRFVSLTSLIDSDDFARNLKTIIFIYNKFKAPKIASLSNHNLKNFTRKKQRQHISLRIKPINLSILLG